MALPELVDLANQIAGLILIPLQIPDPAPAQPPGTQGVSTLLGWLKWIGFAVVAGAIIAGGMLIAVALRRGEGQDALTKVLWPCAGAIVIGGGIAMVSALMT